MGRIRGETLLPRDQRSGPAPGRDRPLAVGAPRLAIYVTIDPHEDRDRLRDDADRRGRRGSRQLPGGHLRGRRRRGPRLVSPGHRGAQAASGATGSTRGSAQEDEGWTVVRSVKHLLASSGLSTRASTWAGGPLPIMQVLRETGRARCYTAIRERSSLHVPPGEPLRGDAGRAGQRPQQPAVPHGGGVPRRRVPRGRLAQRALRRQHRAGSPRPDVAGTRSCGARMLVYDFGGRHLRRVARRTRRPGALGPRVGGDLEPRRRRFRRSPGRSGARGGRASPRTARDELSQGGWFSLHEVCRQHKEALHPNARRIVIDLDDVVSGWPTRDDPRVAYYERCEPFVARTLDTVERLLDRASGHSGARAGRRWTRSSSSAGRASCRWSPAAARAVRPEGQALRASAVGDGHRAGDPGRRRRPATCCATASRATSACGARGMPAPRRCSTRCSRRGRCCQGRATRRWRRRGATTRRTTSGTSGILECSHLAADGRPSGDLTHWDEIRFPFVPALTRVTDLSRVEVAHDARGARPRQIEESCRVDAGGTVVVTLTNLTAGYIRDVPPGALGERSEPLKPARRRRSTSQPPPR